MIKANVNGPLWFSPKMKVTKAGKLAGMLGKQIKYIGRGKLPDLVEKKLPVKAHVVPIK